jgi:hypothetical protein
MHRNLLKHTSKLRNMEIMVYLLCRIPVPEDYTDDICPLLLVYVVVETTIATRANQTIQIILLTRPHATACHGPGRWPLWSLPPSHVRRFLLKVWYAECLIWQCDMTRVINPLYYSIYTHGPRFLSTCMKLHMLNNYYL